MSQEARTRVLRRWVGEGRGESAGASRNKQMPVIGGP